MELIKAAHRGGGRSVAPELATELRNGWVQVEAPREVVIVRNGKIGYRKIGVATGPLGGTSFLEQSIRRKEAEYLQKREDDAVFHLTTHRAEACRAAVEKRSVAAKRIAARIAKMYAESRLPAHNRATAIFRQLNLAGDPISERRVRQIIKNKKNSEKTHR